MLLFHFKKEFPVGKVIQTNFNLKDFEIILLIKKQQLYRI